MGLFKKEKKELAPLWSEGELADIAVNYESVLDYLQRLSDSDFDTVIKVAGIYRKANHEAAKALGGEFEPTAFILEPVDDPEPVTIDKSERSLLDDDELSPNFLEDDADSPASTNRRKAAKQAIKVKD